MPKKIHQLILIALIAFAGPSSSSVLAQRQPKDDLHTRTKKAGGKLIWRYTPSRGVVYPNVEELAKRSDIIIVGRTIGHRPRLTPDGRFITQDFLVRVQEVFKGEVLRKSSILISLPGGSHKFEDGSHVSVIPTGFEQAIDGTSYVFFLKGKKNSNYKGYRLASETQGLFALKDRKVEPAYAGPSDPIAMKYQGQEAITFLQQLRAAVSLRKN